MNYLRKILALIFVASLVACASSGAVPIGLDTFMITKQSSTGFHSGASVKAEIYKEAFSYCTANGLNFQPIKDNSVDGIAGGAFANAEIVFRCLKTGDSELTRPTPTALPNVRIENIQR